MKIRNFKKSDAKRCSEIIYSCVDLSKKTTKSDKDHLKKIYTPLKTAKLLEKSDFFVVENNKKVIGMGRLQNNKIATIYFDPKFHKKGGGRLIMGKLEALAKKRKLRKIWLESLLQSIGFYEKLGFKKVKRLYHPVNSFKMVKDISN
jgi:N-acetylglutamate synthase-like GNAT family acetyltransferase